MIKDLQLLKARIQAAVTSRKGRKRIGFVRPRFPLYGRVMPSIRLRVYDPVIQFAGDDEFILEFYNPVRSYDAVIFQKYFDADAYELANRLQEKGVRIVFDINVNFYANESAYVPQDQHEQVMMFTELADAIMVASPHLKTVVEERFPGKPITVVEENIPDKFFATRVTPHNPPRTFLWVGYKQKVKELEPIKDILSDIAGRYGIGMRTVGGHSIDLGEMKVETIRFRETTVQKKMRAGDVFVSPRDLSDPYNLTHTFTKVGLAMAMGIPVIASPLPSYIGSPAIFCSTHEEWERELTNVASGKYDLDELSRQSRQYAWEHYRPEKIMQDYKRFFQQLFRL